jgi:two-component system response regulator NreC
MHSQDGGIRPSSPLERHTFQRKPPVGHQQAPRDLTLAVDYPGTLESNVEQVRILIVDDHAVVRRGTAVWLASRPELRVVAEAESATEAIAKTIATKPDIVLLDIGLGDEGGLFAAQEITRVCPTARVIAFTGSKDPIHVRGIIVAGARGYVLKTSEPSTIFAAIAVVLTGHRFFDPDLSDLLVSELELFPAVSRRSRRVLAPRETQVLALIASGYTYREIGEMLGIRVCSVNAHRKRIYVKLGFTSKAEAVRYAAAIGLTGATNKRPPVSTYVSDFNSTPSKPSTGKAV